MNVSDDDSDESDFNPEKEQMESEDSDDQEGEGDEDVGKATERTNNPLDSSDDDDGDDANNNLPEDEASLSDDSDEGEDAVDTAATGLDSDSEDDRGVEESTKQLLNDTANASDEKDNSMGENNEDDIEARVKAVQDVFGDDDDGLPDDEASISSGSDSEEDGSDEERERQRRKKKKKRKFDEDGEPSSAERKKKKKMRKEKKEKKNKKTRKEKKSSSKHRDRLAGLVEREAEESSDASSDDDDLDSGDDNEYEIDGFVVGDDEVESVDEASAADSSDSDGDLFDQDKKKKKKKKGLNRLVRNEGDILDDDELELINENAREEEFLRAQKKREILKVPKARRLDDDELAEDDFDDVIDRKQRSGLYDDDELGDFIVDDIAEQDGQADESVDRERRQERRAVAEKRRGAGWPSEDQLEDAMAVFGADFDFEEDLDANNEALDEAREAEELAERRKKALHSAYERIKLIEAFMTDKDAQIKSIDKPERFQTTQYMVGREQMPDEEREAEAKWIVEKLLQKIMTSQSEDNMMDFMMSDDADNERLLESVIHILRFIQLDQYECPFIWTYRSDYLHPKITRNNLWFIFSCDERWEMIMRQKQNVSREMETVKNAASKEVDESGENIEQNEESLEMERQKLEERYDDLKMQARDVNLQYSEAKYKYEEARRLAEDNESSENLNTFTEEVEQCRVRFSEEEDKVEVLRTSLEETQGKIDQLTSALHVLRDKEPDDGKYRSLAVKDVIKMIPVEMYSEMVRQSYNETEIEDIQTFLNLMLIGAEADKRQKGESDLEIQERHAKEGKYHRIRASASMDAYTKGRQVEGMRELIESFSITAAEFGESQRLGIKVKEPQTPDVDVMESAMSLVDKRVFQTPDGVLNSMRTVLAVELAMEPNIKKAAREMYRQKVLVNTILTEKGIESITPFHEMFGFHIIENKPVSNFMYGSSRTLFAKLAKMEADNLIKIKFDFPRTQDSIGNMVIDTSPFMNDLRFVSNFMPTLAPDLDMNPAIRKSWDEQRLLVLNECIVKQLIPSLEVELRRELLRNAREAIIEEAKDNFYRMVSIGPYRDREVPMKRVLKRLPHRSSIYSVAVVYIFSEVDRKDKMALGITMAYLDRDGVVKDYNGVLNSLRSQGRDKVKQFLKAHKPEVVVVNASGGQQSKTMLDAIKRFILPDISREMQQEQRDLREERLRNGSGYADDDDDDQIMESFEPDVLLASDDVARIYRFSRRSKKVFPDLPGEICSAISLGRYVQEPLAAYCDMFCAADAVGNFGVELTFLNIHPMQSELKGVKSLFLKSLEQVLLDVVGETGVDFTEVIQKDHLAPMLAFISGLGLRKANALRQMLRKDAREIIERKELLERHYLDKVVYTNAIGFIKIDASLMIDEEAGNRLDATRIHPECYIAHDFTRKICSEALEVENNPELHNQIVATTMKDSSKSLKNRIRDDPQWLEMWDNGKRPTDQPPRRIMASDGSEYVDTGELQDSLSTLDLDGFAEQVEASGKGKRYQQFNQIKEELRFPWLDLRKPLAEPSREEMFNILTGETDYTLHVGMVVSCKVLRIEEFRAQLMVDNALRGYVSKENISDIEYTDITQAVSQGMMMSGVIIAIRKDRMMVEVSSKESDLKQTEAWWIANRSTNEYMKNWLESTKRAPFDEHFGEEKAYEYINKANEAKAHTREQSSGSGAVPKKAPFRRRVVYHPSFENCTFIEAEKKLREAGGGAGEVIIRPSGTKENSISITWAFQDNWFKHIDVEERDKRPNDQGLGKTLIIQGRDTKEEFTSLDEIIANYIGPMNDNVAQMMAYKSFKEIDVSDAEPLLLEKSKEDPNRIPYFVCFDRKYAGYFALIWYVKESVTKPYKVKYISVRPNGFKMDDQIFLKPSKLMDYFKQSQARSNSSREENKKKALPPPPSRPSVPKPPSMAPPVMTGPNGPVRRGLDAVKPAWMTRGGV